jgi:signal transduction histidine kinase/ActR/RegA family two-component response regulator
MPGFYDIERQETSKNIDRCKDAIKSEIDRLKLVTGDWAYWDDMYAFAQNGDAAFIKSNFQWESLHNSQIEFVHVEDLNRNIVWSDVKEKTNYSNGSAAQQEEINSALKKFLNGKIKEISYPDNLSVLSGIILTEKNPLMILSMPILTSKASGPSKGRFIVGRFLTQQTIKDISKDIKIHFEIKLPEAYLPAELKDLQKRDINNFWKKLVVEDKKVIGYSIIQTFTTPLILKCQTPRDISAIGLQTAQFTSFIVLIILTLMATAFTVILIYAQAESDKKRKRHRLYAKNEVDPEHDRIKKMEAIGLMAGGVAHDLSNILTGISEYPDIIIAGLPEGSPLSFAAETIKQSGKKATEIVNDLMTVARGDARRKDIESLNNLIQNYFKSPEQSLLKKQNPLVSFETKLADNLVEVRCSRVNIYQCIMNLVRNATEAITGEGTISVKTRNITISGKDKYSRSGEYALIEISDTGHGIKEEDFDHIFEPFYTRKVMGRSGTGLGLAIVWNAIQDHNGTVEVTSNEHGTTFVIHLPAAHSQNAPDSFNIFAWPQQKKINSEPLATANNTDYKTIKPIETPTSTAESTLRNSHINEEKPSNNKPVIILIDDEELQRDIATSMLKRLDYIVIAFSSGEEAIKHIKKTGQPALMIIDMIMNPGISGIETFYEARKIYPEQKVIISSGLSNAESIQKVMKLGGSLFLQKPYSLKALDGAVHQVLSS